MSNTRIALVTGASRGIGAAIAQRLVQDGFHVAITYSKNAEKAKQLVAGINAKGGKAIAIQSYATDPKAQAALVDTVIKHFGKLDVLVNNAGTIVHAALPDVTDDDYDLQFNINVRAVFIVSRAASKVLPEGGRIINIGSVNGHRLGSPGVSVYGATKAAISLLTQGWARDLAPKGITVNNVQPGPIDTDLNPKGGPHSAALTSATALNRYGTPNEVASLVSFLASPQSSYITGANINVDGGMSA